MIGAIWSFADGRCASARTGSSVFCKAQRYQRSGFGMCFGFLSDCREKLRAIFVAKVRYRVRFLLPGRRQVARLVRKFLRRVLLVLCGG